MIPILWQGALLGLVLVVVGAGAVWLAYRWTWRGPQRWMEATRHQHRLALVVGRWIWFRWIHVDCRYWIFHVDFRRGPIELRGHPPPALFWSFTYNTGTEVNPVVNSEAVELDPDGTYRIVLSRPADADAAVGTANWIPVSDGAGLGVIYFRIYAPEAGHPSFLPSVRQGERALSAGGAS